jgi:hypothetical protein
MIVKLDAHDIQHIRQLAARRQAALSPKGRARPDAYLLAVYGEYAFAKRFADYKAEIIADNKNRDGDILIPTPRGLSHLVYDVVTVDAADERNARRNLVVPATVVESRGKESRVIYVLARKLDDETVELVGYCYGTELKPDPHLQRFGGYSRSWRDLWPFGEHSRRDAR